MRTSPFAFVLLLLVAYSLPWVSAPTIAGFTNGAYDLAEWASIVPSVRADSLLLTPLLLRIPLACIAVYLVLSDTRRSTLWLRIVGLDLLVIALLPPLEYFTSASGDANYQQSFFLALATLILGAVSASLTIALNPRAIARLSVAPLAAAAISGSMGLMRALPTIQAFKVDVQMGIGIGLFVLVSVICALWTFGWRATRPLK